MSALEEKTLLGRIDIHNEVDVLRRFSREKRASVAVALIWRTSANSPTGFSGWELVRPDLLTGDPVADRYYGGNKFFHRKDEALEHTLARYSLTRMTTIPGFARSLFPVEIRKAVLAWIRRARKMYG